MAIFEKYHPLLSEHYTLDWLTAAKLKDVYALRADVTQAQQSGREVDASITDTAHYVNRSMRLVMSNQALLYGIVERGSERFVGSVCLWQFDQARTQAQLRLETAPGVAADAVIQEILPRVIGFAFFELGLTSIHIVVPETATTLLKWLEANHFTKRPYAHQRTIGEQKVALLDLALSVETVADDPRYRF
ncbi:GNAT family N-acetyltransferase [Lacticaseibacillus jixiensis]|uniref:GNAT family N-acetyltransferase n=1 Tax=Lacticaseibacillus jixiensis TaxID=3231926 RepID=UPI0036F3D65D